MERSGGLRGGQLDGLALVLVVLSGAVMAVAVTSAWSVAGADGGWTMLAPNQGVIRKSGTDWEAFVRTLALSVSPLHLVLLGGALALVGRRDWSAMGRPGHAAAGLVFALGLVLAGLAGLGTWFTVTNDAGPNTSFDVDVPDRLATSALFATSTLGLAYAAWGAFTLLPVATASPAKATPDGAGDEGASAF